MRFEQHRRTVCRAAANTGGIFGKYAIYHLPRLRPGTRADSAEFHLLCLSARRHDGGAGRLFLRTKRNEKSRLYLGIGFVLWGVSALAAGTSYQAFGYELKCRGQDFCLFTSNWELVYMLLAAYSINCLMVAVGHETLREKGRNRLIKFAVIDSVAYSLYMLTGSMIPNRFVISYEGFVCFIGINFVVLFVINAYQYAKKKDKFNRNMIILWLAFIVVNAGYFGYLYAGIAEPLYEKYGIWFKANDVLHVLLIAWAALIFLLTRKNTGNHLHIRNECDIL